MRERIAREKSLVLGVRPHGIHIGDGRVKARVVTSQWLGDQTHVAAELAGRMVVSVVHERLALSPGAEIGVSVRPNDIHLFMPESGNAIAHGGDLA